MEDLYVRGTLVTILFLLIGITIVPCISGNIEKIQIISLNQTSEYVIITDNKNRVLILKRATNVEFSPNFWDLPGGKVEESESLESAVKREVKEESALEVKLKENYFFVYH